MNREKIRFVLYVGGDPNYPDKPRMELGVPQYVNRTVKFKKSGKPYVTWNGSIYNLLPFQDKKEKSVQYAMHVWSIGHAMKDVSAEAMTQ